VADECARLLLGGSSSANATLLREIGDKQKQSFECGGPALYVSPLIILLTVLHITS